MNAGEGPGKESSGRRVILCSGDITGQAYEGSGVVVVATESNLHAGYRIEVGAV
jgi:hypothetical protein